MDNKNDNKLLRKQIDSINEEIKNLSYKLSELLNLNCSFGHCIIDPEVTAVQNRIIEAQATKALLERIKKHEDTSENKDEILKKVVNS